MSTAESTGAPSSNDSTSTVNIHFVDNPISPRGRETYIPSLLLHVDIHPVSGKSVKAEYDLGNELRIKIKSEAKTARTASAEGVYLDKESASMLSPKDVVEAETRKLISEKFDGYSMGQVTEYSTMKAFKHWYTEYHGPRRVALKEIEGSYAHPSESNSNFRRRSMSPGHLS